MKYILKIMDAGLLFSKEIHEDYAGKKMWSERQFVVHEAPVRIIIGHVHIRKV
jgi:hypothetical protein